MAKVKKTRTLTLSDEVFIGLKTIALIKGTSVSKILEDLGKKYIVDNRADLAAYYQAKANSFSALDFSDDEDEK